MTYEKQVERYNKFIQFRKEGKTLEWIAKKYGISRQAVCSRIKKGYPQKNISAFSPLNVYEKVYGEFQGRERTRMLVRIRDNFTCQNCGVVRTIEEARKNKKRLFDIHHLNGLCGKKSRSYDKVSEMDGLITLCHKCHFNRHDKSKKFENCGSEYKISDKKFNAIIVARKNGISLRKIGKTFGVTGETIRLNIKNRL